MELLLPPCSLSSAYQAHMSNAPYQVLGIPQCLDVWPCPPRETQCLSKAVNSMSFQYTIRTEQRTTWGGYLCGEEQRRTHWAAWVGKASLTSMRTEAVSFLRGWESYPGGLKEGSGMELYLSDCHGVCVFVCVFIRSLTQKPI